MARPKRRPNKLIPATKSDSKKTERTELNLELYKKIYLIRSAEKAIIRYYPEDEMKTPMHMSMGDEAIVAGVCEALGGRGQYFSTYRSHAVYLANTNDTDGFFQELYGRIPGTACGKAGSMHLSSPSTGYFGASAIVGSVLPPALGAAFANLEKNNGKIVAAFFGDGALDEGNFWESLNLACAMMLPVLMVCEDNGYAVHIPKAKRQGYDSISEIVLKFRCAVFELNSTDPEEIYLTAKNALEAIQKEKTPCFLQLHYYRYLEHVGINEDFKAGYRSRDEFEPWEKRDPVFLQRKKLLELGISEKEILRTERGIDARVEKSVLAAKRSPFPGKKELYAGVFYERKKKNQL